MLQHIRESFAAHAALLEERIRLNQQPYLPMTSPTFLIGANAFYLLFTWVLYRYMSSRPSPLSCKSFKTILLVYNGSCVLLAGYVAVGIIHVLLSSDMRFVCNETMTIGSSKDNGYAGLLAHLFWVFYAQKFWEFLDTWFFIMRKSFRQVTFLHVFHHCSINIVVGTLLPYEFNGDMFLPILLNAVVHVLMYGHYLVSALGLSTPWKPYLTSIQLLQFVTIATQSCMSLSRGDSCGAPFWGKLLMVAYMGSMLVLFGNFFFHAYILKKPSPSSVGVVKRPEPVQVTTTHTGRTTLDSEGLANIPLPSAFAGGEVHYQVTPLGLPMPNLHVSKESTESDCSFALAGGVPSASVSWTVTKVTTLLKRPDSRPNLFRDFACRLAEEPKQSLVSCCDNLQDAQAGLCCNFPSADNKKTM